MKTEVSESIDNRLMTSIKWLNEPEFHGIQIIEPSGWEDYDNFYRKKVSRDEFILRLAKSEFKSHEKKS